MSNWIHFDKDWFNLDDFCHIWIQTSLRVEGYYLMGEWRHNAEEVVLSQTWDSLDELRNFLNRKLEAKKNE